MAAYESEYTCFMRQWLAQHPEALAEQQSGRALWWDKPPRDADAVRRDEESRVPRKAYYYDAN
jgi:hypothetical protein